MDISADFFENLVNICLEGVIGNDLEGTVIFFNPSAGASWDIRGRK